MSAKKIFEDENTDSGFLSGPLSEQLLDSENFDVESNENRQEKTEDLKNVESSEKIVLCESSELDSGLDLCLSECLSNVNLSELPPPQPPLIVLDSDNDIPTLRILFQPDKDGDTQLHIAAVRGCEKSVGILIRICPDKVLLDMPNDQGHTPLHLATMSGHAVCTRMLVRAGASIGVRDTKGETPLHKATSENYLECLQALLAPVTGQQSRKLSTILNQKNYNGQACVHVAAAAGHLEALHTLVFYGADINAREGLGGCSALHVAVRRGDGGTVRWLLERCAGVASGARDYAGRTPRHLAKRYKMHAFFAGTDDADDQTDTEDEYDSDSDTESLFERLRQTGNAINVV